MGACYASGTGVVRDMHAAANWFRKAADQGNAQAQYNLALCYERGEGVPADTATALSWYEKAAAQGNADAAAAVVRLKAAAADQAPQP